MIANDITRTHGKKHVKHTQHQLQHHNAAKVFVNEVVVLRYVLVVEIGDPKIKEDIE
jgi:predicted nucleic-acid-binding protein